MSDVLNVHSLFEVKSIDSERRVFKGIATMPVPDRVGDVIDHKGVKFTNPLVLLHQHDHSKPIGRAVFYRAASGIEFEAEIPVIHEEGSLKDRCDTAWGEIKYGIVRAVSMGFRWLKPPTPNKAGGYDYSEIECYELSAVSVPALPSAVITSIKSLDNLTDNFRGLIDNQKCDTIKLLDHKLIPNGSIKLINGSS